MRGQVGNGIKGKAFEPDLREKQGLWGSGWWELMGGGIWVLLLGCAIVQTLRGWLRF